MIFEIGPFTLYRVEKSGTLDISLKCLDGWACGWEYGYRDDLRGHDEPLIEFRIGKLMVFYVQVRKDFYEIWFMGFWCMPSWEKKSKRRTR